MHQMQSAQSSQGTLDQIGLFFIAARHAKTLREQQGIDYIHLFFIHPFQN